MNNEKQKEKVKYIIYQIGYKKFKIVISDSYINGSNVIKHADMIKKYEKLDEKLFCRDLIFYVGIAEINPIKLVYNIPIKEGYDILSSDEIISMISSKIDSQKMLKNLLISRYNNRSK